MTIGVRPFFQLKLRRVWGEARFERKEYGRLPAPAAPPMSVAPQEAKLGGPATQQLVRNIAASPATWQAFLAKALHGSDRARYLESIRHFSTDPAINPGPWEAVARETGFHSLHLDDTSETEVSPGAQLFALASNLSGLGLLAALSRSTGQAGIWQDQPVG